MPVTLGLGAAGLLMGAARTQQQKKQADAERIQRAAEIRYSPWTGIKDFTEVNNPDAMGNMMTGGLAGAAVGQGFNKVSAGGGSSPTPDAQVNAKQIDQASQQYQMPSFASPWAYIRR